MPSQTTPLLRGVRQIAYVVHDVPAAVRYWRDALGARLLFEPPGMAFFDVGGLRIMLSRPEKPEFDHPNSVLYFGVDDIRAAHAELSGRGVPFVDEPHLVAKIPGTNVELWMAFFRDPEGNLLALSSEVQAK